MSQQRHNYQGDERSFDGPQVTWEDRDHAGSCMFCGDANSQRYKKVWVVKGPYVIVRYCEECMTKMITDLS